LRAARVAGRAVGPDISDSIPPDCRPRPITLAIGGGFLRDSQVNALDYATD
jgi:hypothetical protein